MAAAAENTPHCHHVTVISMPGLYRPFQFFKIMLGDFNARVGTDHGSLPGSLGHFGISKMNENGQRFLNLRSHRKLCIPSSFFKTKPHHKFKPSCKHLRSGH